ncbi:MAG: hypothetical protein U5R06_08605 [candidate division KSB1 bacterium]|nr:hypothetical protein [candidate division KSB1 bacterium]
MLKKQVVLFLLLTGTVSLAHSGVSTFAFNINGHKHNMPEDLVQRAVQEWYEASFDSAALIAHMDSLVSKFDLRYGLDVLEIRLPDSLMLLYLVDSSGTDMFSGRIILDAVKLYMVGFGCDLYADVSCTGLQFSGNSSFNQGDYQLHLNPLRVLEPEVVVYDSGCGLGELSLMVLQELFKEAIMEYLEEFSSQVVSFLSRDLLARLNPIQSLGIHNPELLAAAVRGFPMHMRLYTQYDNDQDTVQLVQHFDILTGTVENPQAFVGIEPDLVTEPLLRHGGFACNYWTLQHAFAWHTNWDEAQRVNAVFNVMQEYGITGYRVEARWRDLQKYFLHGPDLNPDDLTPAMINACLADTAIWNSDEFDRLQRILDKGNSSELVPLMILGTGHEDALPLLNDGRVVAPATETWMALGFSGVNADEYLYNLKLLAHAVVRRYANKVDVWQLENELNAAGWAAADSMWWRKGDLWLDAGFRDRVWSTLVSAVRAEDATARIAHDFHILDIMPALHAWLDDLDIVGVNFYPNAMTALPVLGFGVGDYVWAVRRALTGLGRPDLPVWVIETGYPGKESTDPPDSLTLTEDSGFFSESRQAAYIRDALQSAAENGARGFFYYTLTTVENDDENAPALDRHLRYCGLVRRDSDAAKPGLPVFAQTLHQLRSSVYENRPQTPEQELLIAPNPFNRRTFIRFILKKPQHIRVCMFNIKGRLVARILDCQKRRGCHHIAWTAVDDNGRALPSGIYFCSVSGRHYAQTAKLIVLK